MFRIVLVAAATILGAASRYIWPPGQIVFWFVIIGAALAACWLLADRWVRRRPVLATYLYQTSPIAIFLLVAASSFLATWLALRIPTLVSDLPEDDAKNLGGVILGALSALVGAAWLDDAKKEDGSLWPEARQRAALSAAFADDPKLDKPATGPRSDAMNRLYAAVYKTPDTLNSIKEWSFRDRLSRARVIKARDR